MTSRMAGQWLAHDFFDLCHQIGRASADILYSSPYIGSQDRKARKRLKTKIWAKELNVRLGIAEQWSMKANAFMHWMLAVELQTQAVVEVSAFAKKESRSNNSKIFQ